VRRFFVRDSRDLGCTAERNSCPINVPGSGRRDCDRRPVFIVVADSGTQAGRRGSASRDSPERVRANAAARVADSGCRSGIVWVAGGKHVGVFGNSVRTVDGTPSDRVADVACVDSLSRAPSSRADGTVAGLSKFRVEPPVDVTRGFTRLDTTEECRTIEMVVRVSTVLSCRCGPVLLEPREPDCLRVTLPADDSVAEFRREHRSAARSPLQVYPPGQNSDVVRHGTVIGDCSAGADRSCGLDRSPDLSAPVVFRNGENVVSWFRSWLAGIGRHV